MNVQFNNSGNVIAQWVKMAVSKKQWSGLEYIGSYYKLSDNDKTVIVAFRRPLYDEPLPHHLEVCSDKEIDYFEKARSRW